MNTTIYFYIFYFSSCGFYSFCNLSFEFFLKEKFPNDHTKIFSAFENLDKGYAHFKNIELSRFKEQMTQKQLCAFYESFLVSLLDKNNNSQANTSVSFFLKETKNFFENLKKEQLPIHKEGIYKTYYIENSKEFFECNNAFEEKTFSDNHTAPTFPLAVMDIFFRGKSPYKVYCGDTIGKSLFDQNIGYARFKNSDLAFFQAISLLFTQFFFGYYSTWLLEQNKDPLLLSVLGNHETFVMIKQDLEACSPELKNSSLLREISQYFSDYFCCFFPSQIIISSDNQVNSFTHSGAVAPKIASDITKKTIKKRERGDAYDLSIVTTSLLTQKNHLEIFFTKNKISKDHIFSVYADSYLSHNSYNIELWCDFIHYFLNGSCDTCLKKEVFNGGVKGYGDFRPGEIANPYYFIFFNRFLLNTFLSSIGLFPTSDNKKDIMFYFGHQHVYDTFPYLFNEKDKKFTSQKFSLKDTSGKGDMTLCFLPPETKTNYFELVLSQSKFSEEVKKREFEINFDKIFEECFDLKIKSMSFFKNWLDLNEDLLNAHDEKDIEQLRDKYNNLISSKYRKKIILSALSVSLLAFFLYFLTEKTTKKIYFFMIPPILYFFYTIFCFSVYKFKYQKFVKASKKMEE